MRLKYDEMSNKLNICMYITYYIILYAIKFELGCRHVLQKKLIPITEYDYTNLL